MTGCRIGRVKLKNGAEVLRFPANSRDDVQKRMMAQAAHFANSYAPGEIDGFIFIAWSQESTLSVVDIARSSMVARSTAPSFAAEEVRRALHQQGQW